MDLKIAAINTGRWLRKANAQAVFACLIISFILVSGLWAFSLLSEVKNPTIGSSSRDSKKQKLPLGIIALADSVGETIDRNFPSVSPFAGAPAKPRRHTRVDKPDRDRPDLRSMLDRFKARRTPPPDQPRVDRPETVSLVYKGIFQRTDGVKMALISDSKSERSSFYKIDGALFGMTLKNIEQETIEVVQENGEPIELKRNQAAIFVEGKHAH